VDAWTGDGVCSKKEGGDLAGVKHVCHRSRESHRLCYREWESRRSRASRSQKGLTLGAIKVIQCKSSESVPTVAASPGARACLFPRSCLSPRSCHFPSHPPSGRTPGLTPSIEG
jgi:hypothetical protein